MRKFHVKKGDDAVIYRRADKGKRGGSSRWVQEERVIVEGACMIKNTCARPAISAGADRRTERDVHILECDEGRGV